MSNKSKLAVITAASIGMVLAQSSAARAETEDNSAPEKITKIAAPIVDEEVLYSALPDEVLEKAAGLGGAMYAQIITSVQSCGTAQCSKGQPVKKPASSSKSKQPNK